MLWQIPHGETPDYIREHPDLQGVDVPRTGILTQSSGLLATATLLFAGEGQRGGPVLRAYDKRTGEAVQEIPLAGPTTGFPITYRADGRQYLVVAALDEERIAELVAFSLR